MRDPNIRYTANAKSLPQPQLPQTKILFVSALSIETGTIANYDLRSRVAPVRNCRKISKKDMKFNDTMPKMRVDAESYVRLPSTLLARTEGLQ